MDGIRRNLMKLADLTQLPFESFSQGDPYDLAQHHLRLALEGVGPHGGNAKCLGSSLMRILILDDSTKRSRTMAAT